MSQDQANYVTEALELIGMDLSEPKKITQEISGFTPMFDAIVNHYKDETRAAVHGAMWRFCQMEDQVCKASLNTIAELIGVDVSTVSRHAEALVQDGYFLDLTPDLRNKPHIYVDTGRVVMVSKMTAGFAQSKATVAESKVSIAQSKATVAESRMSKVLKKDFKKPKIKEGDKPRAPKANDFPSNVLYREVTEKYPKKANWHDVLKFIDGVSRRLGRQPTKDDLFPFYSAWCGIGWNEWSINWLEYAVKGDLPTKRPVQAENKNFNNNISILQSFAQKG